MTQPSLPSALAERLGALPSRLRLQRLLVRATERGLMAPADLWKAAECVAQAASTSDAERIVEEILATFPETTRRSILEAPDEMDVTMASEAHTQLLERPLERGAGAADRYRRGAHLGAGGSANVFAAFDRAMQRTVALKVVREAKAAPQFVHEALVTAGLEHPNIVPIYDTGTTAEGEPFYTMRLVKNRSLRDVMADKSAWPLRRLLAALADVSRALAYAHSRGFVHGDVKPENILIGDFGEVYLADWELAFRETEGLSSREIGLRGTPGYMAPELLEPDAKVGRSLDLFALGVVLYEIFAGAVPFEGASVVETLRRTLACKPASLRERAPSCPLVLEDLTVQLIRKDPTTRPPDAGDVARVIEEFLQGAREAERRAAEAERLATEATASAERYEALAERRAELESEARRLLLARKPWEPVEQKREGWSREQQARELEVEASVALARAIELYTQALGYDHGSAPAHRGLARLHWNLSRRAERAGRRADQAHHEERVRHHDRGDFARQLAAPSELVLHTVPPGAHATIARYAAHDRVLVAEERVDLGVTPARRELAPGSYLVTLHRPGFRDVRYPVLIKRGELHAATVHLYTDDEIGDGFVYVPRGPMRLGGDPGAIDALPPEEPTVDDFAVARDLVTFDAYCRFLDSLEPTEAAHRAPQDKRGSEGLVVVRGPDGRFEPHESLVEGDAVAHFPKDRSLRDLPVVLVNWYDARAFARYESARTGATLRLPLEVEWEKAARGVDGRVFPWGDEFDATFCKMRDSRPYLQQLEPVGAFPVDVSPYGMRDAAGAVREWVGDIYGAEASASFEGEPEPEASVSRGGAGLRQARGGAWMTDAQWCRCASRGALSAVTRGTALGFRLAKPLRRQR